MIEVRRAQAELGVEVELVLLDATHAQIAAAIGTPALRTRDLRPAEHRIIAGEALHGGPSGAAALVEASGTSWLALATSAAIPQEDLASLAVAASNVEAAISAPSEPTPACNINAAAILDALLDVVVAVSPDFLIEYCNPAVVALLGWTPGELVGTPAMDLVHPDDLDHAVGALDRLQHGQTIHRISLRLRDASGGWVDTAVTGLDYTNNDDALNTVLLSIRHADAPTETDAVQRELTRQSRTDQLTGLANRRALRSHLEATRAVNDAVSVFLLDLDQFKAINDMYGHRTGDLVLKEAARRIRANSDDDDFVARIGGDEFVVVKSNPTAATWDPNQVAGDLRAALAEPFRVDHAQLHLNASIGVAHQEIATKVFVQARSDKDTDSALRDLEDVLDGGRLVRDADIALADAKSRGRDRVVIYNDALRTRAEEVQHQRDAFRAALEAKQVINYYQPIVRADGTPVGAEALARFVDPHGRIVEPAEFIDAITGTTLITKLDQQAFSTSCGTVTELRERFPSLDLWASCNFSAQSIAQSDFAESVLDGLSDHGLDGGAIQIEVTETAAFSAGASSIVAFQTLRQHGVRIALDDFGTGYSSLAHLQDLPLSTVKIDRTFVQALHQPGPPRTIASAVRELAASLGYSVIAEGIETVAQMRAATELGITDLQGWHFARPMSAADLTAYLATVTSPSDPDAP